MVTVDNVDVMVFGAHPDDAEIGIGGTIAKLSHEYNYKVLLVDLTDGEPTPLTKDPDERINEAMRAAKILGASRIILDLPNRSLFDTLENRLAVAKVIREYRPKVVFSLFGSHSDDSPDHGVARSLVDAALFYAKLTKWEKYFDDLEPWKVNNRAYYFLRPVENYNKILIVDISDYYEYKIKGLEAYQSQWPEGSSKNKNLFTKLENRHSFYGSLIKCKYGELLLKNDPYIKIDDPYTFLIEQSTDSMKK